MRQNDDSKLIFSCREQAASVLEVDVDTVTGTVAFTCSAELLGVTETVTILITVPLRESDSSLCGQ